MRRGMAPVAANHISGTMNITPIIRPQARCAHSSQKIDLKPSRPMPGCSSAYCGIVLYSANSRCHSASESGGKAPDSGAHSMIDRPEPVTRVAPPSTTMPQIIAATTNSQAATRCRRRRMAAASTLGKLRSSNGMAGQATGWGAR